MGNLATKLVDVIITSLFFLSIMTKCRIVRRCPLTPTAWIEREGTFDCDRGKSKFYHCIRNDKGELTEECRKFIQADPARGCPYFSGGIDLRYMDCEDDTGCPNASDEYFFTNELYKYPACVRPLTTTASSWHCCDRSTELTQLGANVTGNSRYQNDPTEQPSKQLDDVLIIVIAMVSLVSGNMLIIAIVIVYVRRRSGKAKLRQAKAQIADNVTTMYISHVYDEINEEESTVSSMETPSGNGVQLQAGKSKATYINTIMPDA